MDKPTTLQQDSSSTQAAQGPTLVVESPIPPEALAHAQQRAGRKTVTRKTGTMPPVVVAFGRFNPPTKGHEKLFDVVLKTAKATGGVPMIFLSSTQDANKNPLSWAQKYKFICQLMPKYSWIVSKEQVNNPFELMNWLAESGFHEVYFVAGEDRFDNFSGSLEKFATSEAGLSYFKTVLSGKRDEKKAASTTEGVSASKLREAAAKGDFTTFLLGLSDQSGNQKTAIAVQLFNVLRKAMGLKKLDLTESNKTADYEPLTGQSLLTKHNRRVKYLRNVLKAKYGLDFGELETIDSSKNFVSYLNIGHDMIQSDSDKNILWWFNPTDGVVTKKVGTNNSTSIWGASHSDVRFGVLGKKAKESYTSPEGLFSGRIDTKTKRISLIVRGVGISSKKQTYWLDKVVLPYFAKHYKGYTLFARVTTGAFDNPFEYAMDELEEAVVRSVPPVKVRNYMDIGHDKGPLSKNMVWLYSFTKGSPIRCVRIDTALIKQKEKEWNSPVEGKTMATKKVNMDHPAAFGETETDFNIYGDADVFGRVDESKKMISVSSMDTNLSVHTIRLVVKKLREKFGRSYTFHFFGTLGSYTQAEVLNESTAIAPASYLDVGHTSDSLSKNKVWLYMWKRGSPLQCVRIDAKLIHTKEKEWGESIPAKTTKSKKLMLDHPAIFGKNGYDSYNDEVVYCYYDVFGRVDELRKTISVSSMNDEVPSVLTVRAVVKKLREKFGRDYTFHFFGRLHRMTEAEVLNESVDDDGSGGYGDYPILEPKLGTSTYNSYTSFGHSNRDMSILWWIPKGKKEPRVVITGKGSKTFPTNCGHGQLEDCRVVSGLSPGVGAKLDAEYDASLMSGRVDIDKKIVTIGTERIGTAGLYRRRELLRRLIDDVLVPWVYRTYGKGYRIFYNKQIGYEPKHHVSSVVSESSISPWDSYMSIGHDRTTLKSGKVLLWILAKGKPLKIVRIDKKLIDKIDRIDKGLEGDAYDNAIHEVVFGSENPDSYESHRSVYKYGVVYGRIDESKKMISAASMDPDVSYVLTRNAVKALLSKFGRSYGVRYYGTLHNFESSDLSLFEAAVYDYPVPKPIHGTYLSYGHETNAETHHVWWLPKGKSEPRIISTGKGSEYFPNKMGHGDFESAVVDSSLSVEARKLAAKLDSEYDSSLISGRIDPDKKVITIGAARASLSGLSGRQIQKIMDDIIIPWVYRKFRGYQIFYKSDLGYSPLEEGTTPPVTTETHQSAASWCLSAAGKLRIGNNNHGSESKKESLFEGTIDHGRNAITVRVGDCTVENSDGSCGSWSRIQLRGCVRKLAAKYDGYMIEFEGDSLSNVKPHQFLKEDDKTIAYPNVKVLYGGTGSSYLDYGHSNPATDHIWYYVPGKGVEVCHARLNQYTEKRKNPNVTGHSLIPDEEWVKVILAGRVDKTRKVITVTFGSFGKEWTLKRLAGLLEKIIIPFFTDLYPDYTILIDKQLKFFDYASGVDG